jgi:hypothetical protein
MAVKVSVKNKNSYLENDHKNDVELINLYLHWRTNKPGFQKKKKKASH